MLAYHTSAREPSLLAFTPASFDSVPQREQQQQQQPTHVQPPIAAGTRLNIIIYIKQQAVNTVVRFSYYNSIAASLAAAVRQRHLLHL